MKLPSFATGVIWKIAAGASAAFGLILSVLLLSTVMENRSLTKQKQALSLEINDPKTGYIAQLSQSRTNVVQLQTAVNESNIAYAKLSADSKRNLDLANARLAAAQTETRKMERRLGQFLATKPQGATLEDRIWDIDKRALKELVP